jgi:nitrous oxide reductase accessory protein NosL
MKSIKTSTYFLITTIFIISGCDQVHQKNQSVPVTLYKNKVESGNSMTSFLNSNDPEGKIAMTYCNEFRKLYEVDTGEKYVCAPIAYKEFAPSIKWNLFK